MAGSRALAIGGGSHFSGTQNEAGRGYVYMPTMDSREATRAVVRKELVRRAIEAFDNDPFVRGLINNAARMVCGLRPKPVTGDEGYNAEVLAFWKEMTSSAETFDVAGKFDVAQLQKATFRTKYRVGDAGWTLWKSEASNAPRVQFVEGQSIRSNERAKDVERWRDGVRLDANGKAVRYRVAESGDDRGPDVFADFSRADFVHCADFERPGQVRGLPRTYHLLNASLDQREIEYFWSGGIKSSAQVGWYIKNTKRGADGPVGFGHQLTRTNSVSGSGSTRKTGGYTRDAVVNESLIMELEQDEDLAILHDDRPMPQQMEYLDYRKRAMALGFGLPVEVVWNMANLNSANMRATLLMAQEFIDEERAWWACGPGKRLWVWVASLGAKYHGITPPKDLAWWRHEWLPTARKTADFAKDGRVYLELADSGAWSPDRVGAMGGIDQDEEDMVTVERWKKRRAMAEEAGFSWQEIWSRPNGQVAVGGGGSGEREGMDGDDGRDADAPEDGEDDDAGEV